MGRRIVSQAEAYDWSELCSSYRAAIVDAGAVDYIVQMFEINLGRFVGEGALAAANQCQAAGMLAALALTDETIGSPSR